MYFTYNYKNLKSDPERALCSQEGPLWREVSFPFFVDDDVVVVVVVFALLLLCFGSFLNYFFVLFLLVRICCCCCCCVFVIVFGEGGRGVRLFFVCAFKAYRIPISCKAHHMLALARKKSVLFSGAAKSSFLPLYARFY